MGNLLRGRNWTFLVYADSVPKNWREIIASWGISGCISPLHDDDMNPNGSAVRPHWHVLLCFDGSRTVSQVEKRIAKLHPSYAVPVSSVRSFVRYFIHLDNPDLRQYDVDELVFLSGFRGLSFLA